MDGENFLEVYVDGMEGVLIGQPVSKIRFVVIDTKSTPEEPKQRLRLVLTLPTVVMVQACQQILNSMNDSKAQIVEGASAYAKQFAALMGDSGSVTKAPKTSG